jgi:gliding motility-associated-like protein
VTGNTKIIEPEQVYLPGGEVQMINLSGNAYDYFWDFGDGNNSQEYQPVHQYSEVGNYVITLNVGNDTDPQCFDDFSKGVRVRIQPELTCVLLFPNAFTPDPAGPSGGVYSENDPVNYVFHPLHNLVEDFKMEIFNRWGEMIFQTNDINIGWDGYYQDRLVPLGVYVFVAEGTCMDGEKIKVRGDVTVVR